MMRLFARRQDHAFVRAGRIGPARAADRPGRARRRRGPRPRCSIRASWPRQPIGDATSTDLSARVAQALQPYFAQDQFPGISVAVVTDGQVALAQGYGLSNVATGSPVQADTRFDIGSVTKTFTALGVLLLYQESQGTSHPLDLNAPISEYLHNTPSFKLPRQVVPCHHDGAARHDQRHQECGRAPSPGRPSSSRSRKSPSSSPLGRRPRTATRTTTCSASSSSSGPGKSTAPSSRIRSWNRSGCPQTQELGRSATVPNQAVGYDAPRHGRWPKAEVQNGPAMYAAAGMVSTAQDMATYMTALLSGRILDPATYCVDVDLDTDAAIRGESRHPTPSAAWDGIRRSTRAAGPPRSPRAGRSPDSPPSSSSTPPRTAESSSPSTPISRQSESERPPPPCRWPSRCTRRPRPGPLAEGDFDRRRGNRIVIETVAYIVRSFGHAAHVLN